MLAPTAVTHGIVGGIADRAGIRPVVAGRRGDEHAGICGEQHRDLVRGGQTGAATDRVVDDVDAVRDRLVDRGSEVRGEAAELTERLVRDDPGARCDP